MTFYESVIVWITKYRTIVLNGKMAKRLKEIFQDIAERYEFDMDTMEVIEDQCSFLLKCDHSLCSIRDCSNHEERFSQNSLPGIPRGEGAAVGRETLERWIFCAINRR